MSLAEASEGQRNNFDVIRLFAALLVLFYHSFALTDPADPGIPRLGTYGVEIFFVVSGFLVVKSWAFDPRLGAFAVKRALRIFPALWVCILVTAVVGLLFTSVSPLDYLTSTQTWRYFVANLTQLRYENALPGVFLSNPYPANVNGSLWTLPIELAAYVGVAIAGILGLLRRPKLVAVVFGLLLIHEALLPDNSYSIFLSPSLLLFFAAGATLFVWRTAIPLRVDALVALLAVAVLAAPTRFQHLGVALALPYVVMFIAFRTPHVSLRAVGDLSYGTYIYAFVVQQSIIAATHTTNPLVVTLIATPITIALAFASWRLVERPALLKKPRRHDIAASKLVSETVLAASDVTPSAAEPQSSYVAALHEPER